MALLLAIYTFASAGSSAQSLETLADNIRNGTTEQKRTALSTIRRVGTEASARIAVPALADSDEIVRSMAAAAIVCLPGDEAFRSLEPLLADRSEFVRREAAFVLGETGSNVAMKPLLATLINDRSSLVRSAAVAALGKIGDPGAIGSLAGVLTRRPRSSEEYIRRAAARSLGQIAELLRDGTRQTATPQAFLPGKYKHTIASKPAAAIVPAFSEVTRILLRVAADPKEAADTRREAAYALGAIGDDLALPFLRANVNNPDAYFAEICREALLKMPKPE